MKKLQGTVRLLRLNARLDRIILPITLLLAIAMVGASAPALKSAYPTYETQLTYVVSSVSSVAGRMFQGTIQGVSLGSILIAETFMFTAVILAVMSILIVTRHTRRNEESGASELIGSMNVGRNTPLTSALTLAVIANIIAGLFIFLSLLGVPELDVTGSAFFSISLALVGIFFAGITAITVQLSDYSRGSNLMAFSILGASFAIRAVGDAIGSINPDGLGVTASWVSWLSPLGWANQVLPYYDNRIFPLVLLVIGFAVSCLVGYFLLNHRDIGSSIIQAKPGPPRAKKSLLRSGGLAKRLQTPSAAAWIVGAILMGGLMGSVIDSFRSTFEESDLLNELLGASETGNFTQIMVASMFGILGVIFAGYVVSGLTKVQNEESYGRLEYLLSTPLGRLKWLFGHVKNILLGILLTLVSLGLFGAIGYYVAADNPEVSFGSVLAAGLSSLPAMILFMSIILCVYTLWGKSVKVMAWSFYAYCVLITSFAPIFKWPEWTTNLSPFSHTPLIPGTNLDYTPLFVMTGLAIIFFIAAAVFFRKRDIILK